MVNYRSRSEAHLGTQSEVWLLSKPDHCPEQISSLHCPYLVLQFNKHRFHGFGRIEIHECFICHFLIRPPESYI